MASLQSESTNERIAPDESTEAYLFDCDGVLWRGNEAVPGAANMLSTLRKKGKKCYFVTNNATKTRAGCKTKFDALGLDVDAENILCSSFAAATYLEQQGFKKTGKRVYVIGEKGITDELDLAGIPWVGGEDFKNEDSSTFEDIKVDPDVGAVIVGFDRYFNYHKIQYAQLCLENSDCIFIATNEDRVTHNTPTQLWAGNKAMVGAIKGCSGREPVVVGKPSSLCVEILCKHHNLNIATSCMVGDRLDTDIQMGINCGMKTCLVLSGVTTMDMLNSKENTIKPNYILDDVNGLI